MAEARWETCRYRSITIGFRFTSVFTRPPRPPGDTIRFSGDSHRADQGGTAGLCHPADTKTMCGGPDDVATKMRV